MCGASSSLSLHRANKGTNVRRWLNSSVKTGQLLLLLLLLRMQHSRRAVRNRRRIWNGWWRDRKLCRMRDLSLSLTTDVLVGRRSDHFECTVLGSPRMMGGGWVPWKGTGVRVRPDLQEVKSTYLHLWAPFEQ